jgi:hypothetical protein
MSRRAGTLTGWTAVILSVAWLAHVAPAMATLTLEPPSDATPAILDNVVVPRAASDREVDVAAEAFAAEWIAAGIAEDMLLRRVLRRHIEESAAAFGKAAVDGTCDDHRPATSAAAPRDQAASPKPGAPAAGEAAMAARDPDAPQSSAHAARIACAAQAAVAALEAKARREERDMEAEIFGSDLPSIRDMLLESEVLGSLAAPVLELAREYRMQQATDRNAERYIAELGSDGIGADAWSRAAMRGIYAREETSDIFFIRAAIEFLKSPLGILALCLVGSMIVVRTTVRVAVLLQRR